MTSEALDTRFGTLARLAMEAATVHSALSWDAGLSPEEHAEHRALFRARQDECMRWIERSKGLRQGRTV